MSSDYKPSMMQYAKGYAEVRADESEDGLITATISDVSVDRMGDIVEQDGWDLENFRKNPVVLWGHDYGLPPIGRCVDIRVVGGKLKAQTKFADTPLAREVYQLYRGGFMSSFSVGFKPKEYKPIKNADGDVTGLRFVKSELLEYSAVSVPANPNANVTMRHMVQRGMLGEVLRYLPPDVTGDSADELAALIARHLSDSEKLEQLPTIRRILKGA